MNVSRNATKKNVFYIICVLVVGFVSTGAYIMINGITTVNESANRFANYYVGELKKSVKIEVDNRIDEIEYELENMKESEMALMKNKVEQISFLLERLDASNFADLHKRQNAMLNEFNELTKLDNNNYFVLDKEGVLLNYGVFDKWFECLNGNDGIDEQGVRYIDEILRAIDSNEGVYVSFICPYSDGGEANKKTVYCLYLPTYEVIVGTGINDVDIKNDLKDEILARLQSYYLDQDNYVFVTDYDSTSRVSGNPEVVGTKMDMYKTADGHNLHQLFIETANKKSDNFLTYRYYRKDEHILIEKTSYIKSIDEWNCYIGMGFYKDDLSAEIEEYTKEFKRQHYTKLVYIFIGLSLVVLIIYLLVRRGAYLQKTYLEQEEAVFTKLIELSNEAILIISNSGKTLYSNSKANVLFGIDINNHIKNGELSINEIEPSIYSIVSKTGRTYYVEVKMEKILYHGIDSKIYFVNNITTNYLKSYKLEKLTLIDELSGLPNRRALINDFEEKFNVEEKNKKTILGMIDLDNFKIVNDKHGHDVGDEAIKILGEVFDSRLRHTDKFYRYGGEEFIVMLDSTDIEGARSILTDINNKFDKEIERCLGFNLTFSGGLTEVDWDKEPCKLNEFIKEADKLLYKAKDKGRNRIEI